jgi:Sep15/SelM redox domain
LNKLPALQSFLKNGEAEGYHGITIEYISGMEPTLTVYDNNNNNNKHGHEEEEEEVIHLRPYDTNALLHDLMVSQGFVRKSDEERKQIRHDKMEQKKLELAKKEQFRVRTKIYYDKEKYFVEQFQKDVMGGLMQDNEKQQESSIRGGRGGSYYLNEHYRRIYAMEYHEYTGHRQPTTTEDAVRALTQRTRQEQR